MGVDEKGGPVGREADSVQIKLSLHTDTKDPLLRQDNSLNDRTEGLLLLCWNAVNQQILVTVHLEQGAVQVAGSSEGAALVDHD